jgi:hypothetical protein
MALQEPRTKKLSTLPSSDYYSDTVPAAGTFVVGDFVYCTAMSTAAASCRPRGWVCTAGGTPGTWRAVDAFAAAVPTTGSGTWEAGDVIWNTAAAAGGSPGWICTTAGTAGSTAVFKAMANVAA